MYRAPDNHADNRNSPPAYSATRASGSRRYHSLDGPLLLGPLLLGPLLLGSLLLGSLLLDLRPNLFRR